MHTSDVPELFHMGKVLCIATGQAAVGVLATTLLLFLASPDRGNWCPPALRHSSRRPAPPPTSPDRNGGPGPGSLGGPAAKRKSFSLGFQYRVLIN